MTRMSRRRRIGDVILELDNISLAFGGVKALTDISFDVREHEIRAIIGPNGAGKSSMLNVHQRRLPPAAGHDHVPRQACAAAWTRTRRPRRASRARSRTSRCSRA